MSHFPRVLLELNLSRPANFRLQRTDTDTHLMPLPRPRGSVLPRASLLAPLVPRAVPAPLVPGAMADLFVIVVPGVP